MKRYPNSFMGETMTSHDTVISPFSPVHFFGQLPLLRLNIRYRMAAEADLPPFTGFAWRGLVGYEMQRLVCPFDRRPVCGNCLIRQNCPYALLIEEENTSADLSEAPRGYLFDSSRERKPSGDQSLMLTLVGECSKFFPVVIMAVIRGQRTGLGYKRNPYVVTGLEELFPDGSSMNLPTTGHIHPVLKGPFPLEQWLIPVSNTPDKLKIRLKTPIRLRKKGKYLRQMDWSFFFESLTRRLESLNCLFFDGQPLGKEPWLELKKHFQQNHNIQGSFRWWDLQRYSGRQKQKIPMGGIAGEAVMEKPSTADIQWFKAAELVHVGKGAAMGLGKVEIL